MNKQESINFLSEHGITAAAVEHPDMPKKWVLEFLEGSAQSEDFKAYYRDFIFVNFENEA